MLDAIKQWAFTLVITAVVGSLANSLAISDNGGMKKYIKFACAAVALAVIIMPIRGIFKEMPELFNYNADEHAESGIYDNSYDFDALAILKINELLKDRIYDIVYEKTGIKPGDVYIYIGQNNNSEIKVEKIMIEMRENSDNDKIKLYLEQLFDCEVMITGDKINE